MSTLAQIISVTQRLVEANRHNDSGAIQQLDKELELTIGEKERQFGALRQHCKDHGC